MTNMKKINKENSEKEFTQLWLDVVKSCKTSKDYEKLYRKDPHSFKKEGFFLWLTSCENSKDYGKLRSNCPVSLIKMVSWYWLALCKNPKEYSNFSWMSAF